MMEKHYIIYSLTDPRNNVLFYVGITSRPKERLNEHVLNLVVKATDIKKAYFAELRSANVIPIMECIDEITTSHSRYAYRLERAWIRIMSWKHDTLINTNIANDIRDLQQALDLIAHTKWLNQKAIENPNGEIRLGY